MYTGIGMIRSHTTTSSYHTMGYYTIDYTVDVLLLQNDNSHYNCNYINFPRSLSGTETSIQLQSKGSQLFVNCWQTLPRISLNEAQSSQQSLTHHQPLWTLVCNGARWHKTMSINCSCLDRKPLRVRQVAIYAKATQTMISNLTLHVKVVCAVVSRVVCVCSHSKTRNTRACTPKCMERIKQCVYLLM